MTITRQGKAMLRTLACGVMYKYKTMLNLKRYFYSLLLGLTITTVILLLLAIVLDVNVLDYIKDTYVEHWDPPLTYDGD